MYKDKLDKRNKMYVWKIKMYIKVNENILLNFSIECNYNNVNSRYKNIYSSTIRIFCMNFVIVYLFEIVFFKVEIKNTIFCAKIYLLSFGHIKYTYTSLF